MREVHSAKEVGRCVVCPAMLIFVLNGGSGRLEWIDSMGNGALAG